MSSVGTIFVPFSPQTGTNMLHPRPPPFVELVSRPIKALARPPRTPWEEAPARSPNLGKCPNEKSFGKVQGSAGEGRHGICGVPGGFARRHDGGPPVEGNLRQEPGVA